MRPVELLTTLHNLKVEIQSDVGSLKYSGPKGAITPTLLKEISKNKAELMALITNGFLHLYKRYREIENEVEMSPTPHAVFKVRSAEWRSTVNRMTEILRSSFYCDGRTIHGK